MLGIIISGLSLIDILSLSKGESLANIKCIYYIHEKSLLASMILLRL